MKVIKIIINIIILSIMTINIFLIFTINVASYMISKHDLVFVNWVHLIKLRNKWCLIIAFIVFLNICLIKRIASSVKVIAISIISAIIIFLLIQFAKFDIASEQTISLSVNKNGQVVIAESLNFYRTTWVNFYIPVNRWVMKVTNIPQERYNNGDNPYR